MNTDDESRNGNEKRKFALNGQLSLMRYSVYRLTVALDDEGFTASAGSLLSHAVEPRRVTLGAKPGTADPLFVGIWGRQALCLKKERKVLDALNSLSGCSFGKR